jgi:hypothetical protein
MKTGGKPTWIQALCEQYANDPPKRTEPSVLRMSPVSPWIRDDFPEPTAPTIATSCPRGTLKSICFNLNKVSSLTSFGSEVGSGLDVLRRSFFFPFCSLLSSGGGPSQVKDAFSTSRAYWSSGSRSNVSEMSSAVKHSWRRPIALRASAIELKDRAIKSCD